MNIFNSNTIYILITVIILLYTYWKVLELEDEDEYNNNKYYDEYGEYDYGVVNRHSSNLIVVETNKQIMKVNIPNIINHLSVLRDNIITLSKLSPIANHVTQKTINNLIHNTKTDLGKFKSANNYNDHVYYNDHIDAHNGGDNDSIKSVANEINLVIYLLNQKKYNGRLILTNLYALIKISNAAVRVTDQKFTTYEMSMKPYYEKIITSNDEYKSYNTQNNSDERFRYTIDDYNDYNHAEYNHHYGLSSNRLQSTNANTLNKVANPTNLNNNIRSNLVFSNMPRNRKMINDPYDIYNTQIFNNSEIINVVKRNGIQNYIPFYDLDKIRRERDKMRKKYFETITKDSIRNDY
jgi:hypothetical protein